LVDLGLQSLCEAAHLGDSFFFGFYQLISLLFQLVDLLLKFMFVFADNSFFYSG
jgi:hypothetical protein